MWLFPTMENALQDVQNAVPSSNAQNVARAIITWEEDAIKWIAQTV